MEEEADLSKLRNSARIADSDWLICDWLLQVTKDGITLA